MPLPFWASVCIICVVVDCRGRSRAPTGRRRSRAPVSMKPLQIVVVGDADIEVAVGGQHHAVDAVLDEGLLGKLVGLADARLAGGRAARRQIVDGRQDLAPSRWPWSAQHRAGIAGIGDDRHRVVGPELVDQQPEGRLAAAAACSARPSSPTRRSGRPDWPCGCSVGLTSKPLMPICISLVLAFHGVGMTLTVELNGSRPSPAPSSHRGSS